MKELQVVSNKNLKELNTFRINVCSEYFAEINSVSELERVLSCPEYKNIEKFILGGGSNVLFTEDFKGIVIHICFKGIQIWHEDEKSVLLKVAAGENWDDFVEFCVLNNYYGIENLSAIHGRVGASPVQNIGAYGVEAKDVIENVEALEIDTLKTRVFSNSDCKFAYRNSVFKQELKNKYIVSNVFFRLSKVPVFNLEYGNLKEKMKEFPEISLRNIRNSIIEIRNSKLPSPEEFPNAGSFFKNPVIELSLFQNLKILFPDLINFPDKENFVKLAAAQLIEKCGWKGKTVGKTGCYEKQALIIVNQNDANGKEIADFSLQIQNSVEEKFGIRLEPEVCFV